MFNPAIAHAPRGQDEQLGKCADDYENLLISSKKKGIIFSSRLKHEFHVKSEVFQ